MTQMVAPAPDLVAPNVRINTL